MAAKNSSPELRLGDWEDEDVDELSSSECQEGGRFANLPDTDLAQSKHKTGYRNSLLTAKQH